MLKDRKELEDKLIKTIVNSKLKTEKDKVEDIKLHLSKNYQIGSGKIQKFLNNPKKEVEDLDIRELYLFTEQVFSKTGNMEIDPDTYFTDIDVRESRQFSGLTEAKESEIDFPITVTNAQVVGNSAYMVTLDIKIIDKLLTSQLLHYNYDLQREAKYTRRKDKVIIEPTLNMKNVTEIQSHLLQGTLVPTVLVFNAATRSAESGTELIFDSKKMELTITKDTKLDVVDGFHRCRASQLALQQNPELNFNFAVLITNYSTKKSQQYQAQLAKATPLSKTRIQELEANRLSDTVVQQLREESELRGKISQTNRIHSLNKELVTYNVLADTIDEEFKMNTRADAADVGDYLTEVFSFLIGSYPEEFINNLAESRKNTIINDNNMFVGYLVLARRMMENGLKEREIRNLIKNIDFSRDNDLWKELGVLDGKGNIADTVKARRAIKQYFEKLEIK
ncbi:DNA sulfur modification protein DndB [Bacillus infantis]|uniref:DNA sulfur modification protein DndB n=1 Tax=Bacillus infantis TaxID=324767 RepID=UPI0020A1E8E1|nr:DNA sulfur modification protein DndB [Bacillus infantis]MCP1159335.1 DNA sulfur modification protein DndB [Bacillus infantis]